MNEWDDLLSGGIDAFELIEKETPGLTSEGKRAAFARYRLLYFLERGHWTLNEAAHILVGLDPEHPIGEARQDDGIKLRCLPGLKMPREKEERRNFCTECEDDVQDAKEHLSGISEISALKVSKLIAKALTMGLEPPWLEIAKKDPELAAHLPGSALDPRVKPRRRAHSEVTSAGGDARAEKIRRPIHDFMACYLQRNLAPEEAQKLCFRSGVINPTDVARHMREDKDFPRNPFSKEEFVLQTIKDHLIKYPRYAEFRERVEHAARQAPKGKQRA